MDSPSHAATDPPPPGSLAATARDYRSGFVAAVAAHAIWGFIPLYLQLLKAVPATQIMAHRLVWCCVLVMFWLFLRGALAPVWVALRDPATRWPLCASAVFISINWLTFTWAVTNGHVIESSLGYFINPLLNVALGVLFLGERLTPARKVAVLIAAIGVGYLTIMQGRFPYIALILAMSFGLYGLVRKTVPVAALSGLATETLLLAPLGLAYLIWCEVTGIGLGSSGNYGATLLLLVAGGLITAVPLSLFSFGARRIPYSTIGLIQYIGPSIQIVLGIFFFHETFSQAQAISYGLIWLALAIYAGDGLRRTHATAS